MSDVWGTVYQLERDKALGNDPPSLRAEIEQLRARLLDAEMSLAVYDDGHTSEYWLRYPTRANGFINQQSQEPK